MHLIGTIYLISTVRDLIVQDKYPVKPQSVADF